MKTHGENKNDSNVVQFNILTWPICSLSWWFQDSFQQFLNNVPACIVQGAVDLQNDSYRKKTWISSQENVSPALHLLQEGCIRIAKILHCNCLGEMSVGLYIYCNGSWGRSGRSGRSEGGHNVIKGKRERKEKKYISTDYLHLIFLGSFAFFSPCEILHTFISSGLWTAFK